MLTTERFNDRKPAAAPPSLRIRHPAAGRLGVCRLALDVTCPACDNRGLECRRFFRGRIAWLLAVCVRCGHAEERPVVE
jgi:hypothetical protein